MSRLTPANQALEDAVAAVLRDASGLPLSTRDVAEALGARVAPWVVYPRLARLHRTGAIARMAFPDHRSVFWSSTPAVALLQEEHR